jgi:hypothetical protein
MHQVRLVITVIIACCSILACSGNVGTLIVENHATQPIARVAINICDRTVEERQIAPGQKKSMSYGVTCEGHYRISASFQSGQSLQSDDGYITPGFDFEDTIVISDSAIKVSSRRVR